MESLQSNSALLGGRPVNFCADQLIQSLRKDLRTEIDVDAPSWSIDNSPRQVACYRLKESLLKKFNNALKPSQFACTAALGKFSAVNERVRSWGLELNLVQPDWELFSMLQVEVKEFLDPSNLGPLFADYTSMFQAGGVGPGASVGALGCDFYTKMFASRLTSTSGLPDIWDSLVLRNQQLRLAYSDVNAIGPIKVVSHSKLNFVNKNQDVARTICTEPSVNMWMQLGLGNLIHSRLRKVYNIDFSVQQEVNRRMARLGSQLDHLCTMDLESASDSLGLHMMHYVFPKSFMETLVRLRSPVSRLPDGSLVPLHMVSTMGNGFTFPLQTLLFAACCAVVLRYLDIPCQTRCHVGVRNMSVYGDDIIIDKRAERLLRRLLNLLGFVVNDGKTFVEGPFRESCGGDYFLGSDVRPVYVKRLRTVQDSFVAINRLNQWTAKTGVTLRNTVAYVLQVYPEARKCVVPLHEADDSGILTPWELVDKTNRFVPRSFGLARYVKSTPVFYGYRIHRDKNSSDNDEPKLINHPRNVAYNPSGLWVSFLGGYITGYRVSLRQEITRYKTKRMVTPSWGAMRPDLLSDFPDRGARLITASKSNM